MDSQELVMEGTIQEDGTLVLDHPTDLPPGRVQVTVHVLPHLQEHEQFMSMINSIRADQKNRGHLPRSVEDIEAQQNIQREGW